jgi:lipopolysaccharide/colanic/teichoic acid biosynthesis glycosyltransferase
MHAHRRSRLFSSLSESDPLPGWKRAIDLLCCLAALPFLLAATALLSILHALTSPGPLFFTQERVGYRGRTFRLYKFRTMHVDADVGAHHAHVTALLRSNAPMNKMDGAGDRRLMPAAWLLRATGLDELPQLLNVLRGDMSIVGPRPCIPYEYEQYQPWQRARFNAVPGLTGLWQVSGKNHTTFDEMVRLDVRYAGQKSPGLDLWIIARTPATLWSQVRETRSRRRAAVRSHEARVPATPAATFQT